MRSLSGRIALSDGTIIAGRISFDRTIDSIDASGSASSDYILPGLIDLQVNGSHGFDVMSASPDAILEISAKLLREGVTGWLPTAVTSPLEQIERVHRAVAEAMERQKQTGDMPDAPARIFGMHLEGPFISPLRLGAHRNLNLDPSGEALESITALDNLRLITLAPELPGALEAIRRLAAHGVVVSLGHTNATLEEADAGIAAGARMFTHLFNAMRPLGHRDPGVIAAALTSAYATPALIPDGIHVHKEILRLVFRARGAAGMILTTDKVAFAGTAGDSTLILGREGARIDRGVARLPDGTIAGSIISMLEGVRLMVREVGAGVGEAALMAATNPAAILGILDRGRLGPGAIADIIVLGPELQLKAVFLAGRESV